MNFHPKPAGAPDGKLPARTGAAGRTLLLWVLLLAASTGGARAVDTLVTPGASPEAQSLLAYFSDIYGRKIISGQQDGWRGTNDGSFELAYLTSATGRLPALLALDFSAYTGPSAPRDAHHRLAQPLGEHHRTVLAGQAPGRAAYLPGPLL